MKNRALTPIFLVFTLLAGPAFGQGRAAKAAPAPAIGRTDIGGFVRSKSGSEAGVWVIAETTELPTKFAKIVVTDEHGRYLIPDLPKARYDVWVRGYGLVDSPKVRWNPGRLLNLTAVVAPTPAQAAQYYPALYWFAMLRVPEPNAFPLGPVASRNAWLHLLKTGGCQACHALGTPGMRHLPGMFMTKGDPVEAWRERIRSGGAMTQMAAGIARFDTERALKLFADWTDRIRSGELPDAAPERPQGIERNVVVSTWDWAKPTNYLHDAVSTDRRDPRLNAFGRVWGSAENSTDYVPMLDPRTGMADAILHPVRDPATPSTRNDPHGPSVWWGDKPIWDSRTINHNPMMDERGRVWFTARIRAPKNPAFCRKGSSHPSAKAFPLEGDSNRQLSFFDPKLGKFTLINTCFQTHHLNFARDPDQTLWVSSGGGNQGVLGWLNRRVYDLTKDEQRAQGWTPFVLDTNANGKRDEYVEPNEPVDNWKDKRIAVGLYSVAVSPSDGAVWGTVLGFPGSVVRVVPGSDPTNTALAEIYDVPAPGFGPRGGDVDTQGVFWASLASGHLARFDRSKCKVLNGPTATGKHCPEGWTLFPFPGPQLAGVKEPGSAEASYYTWVDWYDTLGLGKDVPIATGNLSDSLLALVDGKFVTLRVPYPSGIFPKNLDGRIDDEGAGWKGRGLWTTSGTRTPFHNEGGRDARPQVVKIQLRPDPLAK